MAEAEDKDVPMDEGGEMDEDELLAEGKNGEEDEAMKEDGDKGKEGEENKEDEEEKKEDEETYDDGGAASDVEFTTEDDRVAPAEVNWKWHIELYPLATEDVALDNFVKIASTADSSHVVYRDNESGEKRGEAHFYTQDTEVAQTLMRTICCRKFTFFRPFIYLYHLKEGSQDQYETAYIRLDLIESAKMRWDKQKKNRGDAKARVAKVSDVPLDTSKEFLKVLFARAYRVKRESDQSEEEAQKAQEAKGKDEAKAESSTADKSEEKEDADEKEEEEEELVGDFNGNVTIDCSTRASLKGFLLGYRKVIIGSSLLVIKPLAEDIDIDALRKEIRKKRGYEAVHGKEWKPVTAADRVSKREEDEDRGGRSDRGGGRGRGGRGGDRGGRGGRGGVMTGRQKMNEKNQKQRWGGGGGGGDRDRWGGRGGRGGGGGGGGGGGYSDDVRYLQSQLAMNTYELQRQIASLRGRDRGMYDMGGGYGGGYGGDEWGGGYGGGQGGGRYGGGGGRGGRKQRGGGGGGGGGWR